jgi:integrase
MTLPRRYPEGLDMAKVLTAASVEKLKSDPARRLEIADGLLPGFYLVIQPSGRKSWAARYRAGGKPRKLTLGSFPAMKLEEAREAARKAIRDAQAGADPAAQKQETKRAAKVAELAERDSFDAVARLFLVRYAKPKNRSWVEQARQLGLVADPTKPDGREDPNTFKHRPGGAAEAWEGRRIQDITRRDVIELLDGIADRGMPIMANRVLAVLRKLFGWAVERDIITANPADKIKAPGAETRRERTLSDEELRAVWIAAEGIGYPFGPFVQMLILSGQRRDEVAGMSWREIDGKAALWTLPASRTKNGRAHDVPLAASAVALLNGQPRIAGDGRLVFSTTGETAISGFSRAKTRLDKDALALLRQWAKERGEDAEAVELPHWTLHDLRRTAATGMARLGIDLPVIEKVLNHVSGSFAGIVGVYQRHSFADEKRRALETWASFVSALVTGEDGGNVVPMRRAAE